MSRTKKPQTSAEIEAEIRRLEEEKERAIIGEDQRRGELLRGYLEDTNAGAIRTALGRVVSPRDAYLFGLGDMADGSERSSRRPRGAEATST